MTRHGSLCYYAWSIARATNHDKVKESQAHENLKYVPIDAGLSCPAVLALRFDGADVLGGAMLRLGLVPLFRNELTMIEPYESDWLSISNRTDLAFWFGLMILLSTLVYLIYIHISCPSRSLLILFCQSFRGISSAITCAQQSVAIRQVHLLLPASFKSGT